MPANLPPLYKEAEQRFRQARTREEKLEALREMLALLPRHKGTDKIHADLRHRIAKLEEEGEHARRSGGRRHDPSHVEREGAGQWVLIGPPNAGKSALVRALTGAKTEVAAYPFTTRVPTPGMMPFEDIQIQLVDTPAVAVDHTEPYLVNLVRGADGILIVLDLTADDLDESARLCTALLARASMVPASPLQAPGEEGRITRPVLVIQNKADLDPDGTYAALAGDALTGSLPSLTVSAEHGSGLESLRRTLFEALERVRVYTKEPGKKPDLERPFVLRRGATVHDLALLVHRELADRLKYARLWGAARFDGQQVDRHHRLHDRDIVELHG